MRMRAERKQRKAERKYGDTEGHCKRLTGQNRKVETDNVQ